MNLVLRWALTYASAGLPVIPLGKRSKHPWLKQWQERGTCDRAQILDWFGRWGESNIGIVTGDGLLALDVDPKNGGDASLKQLRDKLPKTAEALTGSGGRHFLYRTNPDIPVRNAVQIFPGIDIRGKGGQIVVEPSVHPDTGKEYVWLQTPDRVIAEAPRWLVDLVRVKPSTSQGETITLARSGDVEELLNEAMTRFPIQTHGTRNEKMLRLVCSLMGRGYRESLIVETVKLWWQHYYDLGNCRTAPRDAKRQIKATIESLKCSGTLKWEKKDPEVNGDQIVLSSRQQTLLTSRFRTVPKQGAIYNTYRSNTLCASFHELVFVESLVIHSLHALRTRPGETLKVTRDQLCAIIQKRHGVVFANPQFERLKRKYISRPGRPATRIELAVQTKEGHTGVPSEFRLTSLMKFFDD
jgi:hypothetical protein